MAYLRCLVITPQIGKLVMKVRFVISVLCLLIYSAVHAQQKEDLVAKGLEYLNKQDLVRAEKLFLQALEENPKDKWAHYYLGEVYFRQGRWKEAGEEYYKAAKRDFKFKQAWVGYGRALLRQDFPGHNYFAAKQFKKALKVDPRYRDAHFYLAEAYHAMGADEMAESQLKLIIRQGKGDPEAYIRLGEFYEISKNLFPEQRNDKVFEAYSKAVELGPDQPNTHFRLGWAYFRKEEFLKAIKEYEKGFAIEFETKREGNYQNLVEMAIICYYAENYPRSKRCFDLAFKLMPEVERKLYKEKLSDLLASKQKRTLVDSLEI